MTNLKKIKFGGENTGPLRNIKILDLSRLISGGFLTSHFADLGADVIKVEDVKRPDALRYMTNNDISVQWKVLSRNKKSLALDFTTNDDGRELLFNLVRQADALVENFKVGSLEKFGLGPDVLLDINPNLVIARISGWGQTGPYSHKPGFGTLVEAFSGFAAKSGFPDSGPLLPNLGLADMITGITGAFSVLAAINDVKENGGKGQVIDLSLLDGMTSFLGADPAICKATGRPIPRMGNKGEVAAPRNLYLSKDGKYIALSASMPAMAHRLFRSIGREDLIDDPKFRTNEDRVRNSDELDDIIGAFIEQYNAKECLAFFDDAGVTIGPLFDAIEILEDPHVQERGTYVRVDDPEIGEMVMNNIPARFSGTPVSIRTPAPNHGQNTRDILLETGLSDEQIEQLEAKGIIRCGK